MFGHFSWTLGTWWFQQQKKWFCTIASGVLVCEIRFGISPEGNDHFWEDKLCLYFITEKMSSFAGDSVEVVHSGRSLHVHLAYPRRASDLPLFQQLCLVLRRSAASPSGHSGRRAHTGLSAGWRDERARFHHWYCAFQIASKDKLNELQLRVRQLLDQVEQITKEQAYQRYRLVLFSIS